MSVYRDPNSPAVDAVSAITPGGVDRLAPVRLARRRDAALDLMLHRVLPDEGGSRLDVAGFQSAI